jgi:dTDP-4-dehydrorhamnose 3,5-epimerase
MRAHEVTVEWLKTIPYAVQSPYRPPTIEGVIVKDLKVLLDGRGDVVELWSKPWIEAEGMVMPEHVYQSATDYGVVKCWHLHDIHTDQFTVTRGKLQVTLVDIRPDSPTFGHVNPIFLGSTRPRLIKIPPRIMHGWKALSAPDVLVVNLQSHVYDAGDEFKFPWDCVLEDIWEPRNG